MRIFVRTEYHTFIIHSRLNDIVHYFFYQRLRKIAMKVVLADAKKCL